MPTQEFQTFILNFHRTWRSITGFFFASSKPGLFRHHNDWLVDRGLIDGRGREFSYNLI
jgi:hypothetical protein